jgi:hypothetical protein
MAGTPMMLTDVEIAKLDDLKIYAEQPEHYYLVERGDAVPGDKPEHARELMALVPSDRTERVFRVVFSITENKGKRFRQASFRLHGGPGGRVPHPQVIEMFCHHLGFQGGLRDWIVYTEDDEKTIIVVCQVLCDVA